ncbi:MAG: PTS sugar transporter subunit IIC [Lachnospiraceae bacterium]|nr:PTS sugar transporter subunit IIC [Lachnospiraceae bacterium]
MKIIKKWCNRVFIDGLSGMALGLFATLLVGTIAAQIGGFIGGRTGGYIITVAALAKTLTGAGIGVGVATKLKQSPLVVVSAAVAGMTGAFASEIIAGRFANMGTLTIGLPGEPLGAFVASYVAIEVGNIVSGKTKVDILVTPVLTIAAGGIAGILLGNPIAKFMTKVGSLVNWGVESKPIVMGVVVSVLMGMALTLPISSAAIGVSLKLSGIAAGAAVVGCCANMIGFAVASYKENKFGGLIAQGLGTSMLQMPNIIRNPFIWLPAIVSSAILGPVSTCLLKMTCNATGSGMGTCGLVGPIMTYETMVASGVAKWLVLGEILCLQFVLPGVISLGVCEFLRKKRFIEKGDMKLDI